MMKYGIIKSGKALIAVLCLAACCAAGCAAEPDGDWRFERMPGEENAVYIWSYDPSDSKPEEVIVPETLDGCPVKGIRKSAFSGGVFTSLRLPAAFEAIVNSDGTPNAGSPLEMPETLRHLEVAEGNRVFRAKDDALYRENVLIQAIPGSPCEEVHVLDGTTALWSGAFGRSEHLKRLYLPATVTEVELIPGEDYYASPFFAKTLEAFIVAEGNPVFRSVDGLLYRGNRMAYCPRSKDADLLTIQEGTEVIEYGAFHDCDLIRAVQLPASVREIETAAFYGCRLLESIGDLSGVQKIGEGAIAFCWNLRSIGWDHDNETYTLADGALIDRTTQTLLTMIDPAASPSVRIPDGIIRIGDAAMTCLGNMEQVAFPDSVTEIGNDAFTFTDLTEITLPPQVTRLGSEAFYGCDQLKKADLRSLLEALPDDLFSNSEQLEQVLLPDGLVSIGMYAFYRCGALSEIRIPETVTVIDEWAFAYCSALRQVTLPSGLATMGTYCFVDCTALESVTVPGIADLRNVWCFADCTALETAALTEGVEAMDEYLFRNCERLRYLYLPRSLKQIDAPREPFSRCPGLTAVVYPETYSHRFFRDAGFAVRYVFEGLWKAIDPTGAAALLGLPGGADIRVALDTDSLTVVYIVNGETRRETFPCRWDEDTVSLEEGYMHYTLEGDRMTLETAAGGLELEREEGLHENHGDDQTDEAGEA